MMMRRNVMLAVAVVAMGAAWLPAAKADAASDARKAIQAVYNKQNAAAAKKDIDAMMTVYTPDFVGVTAQGQTVDKTQLRQSLTPMFSVAKSVKNTTVIQKFTLKGATAVVTVKEHALMTLVNPQTKQQVKYVGDSVSQDTWVKTARVWQEKHSRMISNKETVNGKPIPKQPQP